MATWQCDFFLLPKRKIVKLFGTVPQKLETHIFSSTEWWEDDQPPQGYEEVISAFLAKSQSWADELSTWGDEQSHRIDVWHRQGLVQEILIRIDASNIDLSLIQNINNFSIFCQSLVFSANTKLLEPTVEIFLAEIQGSNAARFVKNPGRFLNDISQENIHILDF